MERMSKIEQRKMLKALDKAADYTKDGLSPDDAITKVAEEFQLSAPKIERLCEAYNKANAVAYMKTAPEDRRADNYPLAKIANVVNNIYGTVEKEASEIEFRKVNYAEKALGKVAQGLRKTASEKKSDVTPDQLARLAEIHLGQLQKYASEMSREKTKAEYAVKTDLDVLVDRIRRVPATESGRKELNKYAQDTVNAFGEKLGHVVINAINAELEDPGRYMPCLEKTAKAVVLGDDPYYKTLHRLVDNREKMVHFQKLAEEGTEDLANGIGLLNSSLMALPSIMPTPEDPHMDVNTGFTGEWDAYAKDLKSRRLLYDLMLNDDEIKSYSPRKVREVYNDVVETFPELAAKRKILRAIMRKSLAQGGNMDIYELKDLISASKEHSHGRSLDTIARGNLADSISSGNSKNKVEQKEVKAPSTALNINIGG